MALFSRFKAAPLSNGFFFAGIMGFIISAIYWHFEKLDKTYGFTFMLFFAVVFIASLISMTKAPAEAVLMQKTKAKKRKK